MGHGPEEQPLEEELGELAKGLFKLPQDSIDTLDLEESAETGN